MKKFLSLFLSLAMVFAILPAGLFSIKAKAATSGYYTYSVSGGKATITDVKTAISGDITIPSTLGGYPVTSIGYNAFYDCENLTSISIPKGVTSIGQQAFYDCGSLTSVTIPDSVTSIGSSAFYYCTKLTAVHITDIAKWCNISFAGYASNPLNYAKNLYLYGKLVTDLVIPDSVTGISDYAFYYCKSLTSITIPDSVTSIGKDAFWACSNLNAVYITDIAKWCNVAFAGSDSNPLYYAKNLYLNRKLVTDIVIPDGVTGIGDYAFYYCTSLTSVNIPDSVTDIGRDAFGGCTNLTDITFPSSVTSIGDYAFGGCTSLTNITVKEGNPVYHSKGNCIIETATNTLILGCKSSIIPNYVTSIGNHAFRNCTGLTSITIPQGVTSIGNYAFYFCTGLTSVTFSDSVTSLGNYAFYKCTSLTSVCLPDSVKSVGDEVFGNCTGLISASIRGALTKISYAMFHLCSALTSVNIPDSVTSIGSDAFRGCTNLTGITIPDSVTYIGRWAFSNCPNLLSISLPDSVTSIETGAFSGDSSLTSITIPSGVTSISGNTFENCKKLTTVNLPDSITSIGYRAFDNCTGLTSITIPQNVTSIGDYAFYYCTALTSVCIPDGVTSISGSSFDTCSSLTTVTLGNGVKQVKDYAFDDCYNIKTVYIPCGKNKSSISIGYSNDEFKNAVWVSYHHPSGEGTVTNPTCTTQGYTVHICKSCGCSYTADFTEALGHNCKLTVTEPTCTSQGYTHNYCIRCGYSYVDNRVEALGHSYETVVTNPTCISQGYTTHTCKNCGDSYKDNYITDIYAHNYLEEITEATCTQKGYSIYTCEYCSDSYKDNITQPNDNHSYIEEVTEPTCTEKGYTTYTCKDCGNSYIGNYTPIRHQYNGSVVPPTEQAEGYTEYVCQNCGDSYVGDYVSNKLNVWGVKVTASDIDITLSWNSFEGAVEYYAKVYDKDFTKCLKTITTKGTSAVFDYKTLSYNTNYKFIVTAKLSDGKYLTVANATRVDGAMVIGNRVVGHRVTMEGKGAVVSFLPVENATEYLVNVFENDAQGERIYTATLTSDTTTARIMNNLSAGTKYVVMINAKVDGKYMSLADLRVNGIGVTFTAPVINPSSITIADETATSIRFNWDAVRGAEQYFIKVTEKESGKLVNTLKVEGKTTATLSRYTDGTRIFPNTTYLLQFYTYVNSTTNSGEYGAPIEITTIDFEPVTVTARYNRNINRINLTWNSTTNAVGYFVYTYKNGVKTATKYLDGNDNTIYGFTAPASSGTYTYGVVAYEKNSSGTAYTPVSISNEIIK